MSLATRRALIAFGTAIGVIGGILSFFYLGILVWVGDQWIEEQRLSIFWHGFYWFLLMLVTWYFISAEKPDGFESPTVISVLDNGLLVVSASSWLGMNVSTAIYHLDDQFERFVCKGRVVNIQTNKLVQIETSGKDGYLETLRTSRKQLLVKPGMVE